MMDLKEAPALLEDLLKRYSPSHGEGEAVATLVDWMNTHGFQAAADEAGNAVGRRGDGEREIMLLGHIDTVPGFIEVRQEGHLLYGRGAVDAKGPLASFAAAAALVDPLPGWRITVVGAVGEESESHGAMHLRERYRPEYLVIGEPSKWDRITLGFKGSLWVEYRLRQSMAHTAARTESASMTAVRFWNALEAWCAAQSPADALAFYRISPSLRAMRTDSDDFSEIAELKINLRLPPGVTPLQIKARLEEMKGEAEIRLSEGLEAYRAEKNTPLVRAFLRAIRQDGGTPGFTLKSGTSDMNIVAPLWGCPAVAYGPGDSSLDHTPDEHISLAEFGRGVGVLAGALQALMKP